MEGIRQPDTAWLRGKSNMPRSLRFPEITGTDRSRSDHCLKWRFCPELRFLCGPGQGRQGRLAAGDYLGDGVEIAGAHFALVTGGGVTVGLGGELSLLHDRKS